ncbi:MAG: hypothetical protein K9L61_06110 [Candidatus Omnitrophica bacterium]|nr:hypothetical protein [Candidatus Omnitrophota bacterium]
MKDKFNTIDHIQGWIMNNMPNGENDIINKVTVPKGQMESDHSGLGVSSLGAKCKRTLQYRLMGKKGDAQPNMTQAMIFLTGHWYHCLFQYICKEIWKDKCEVEVPFSLIDPDIKKDSKKDIPKELTKSIADMVLNINGKKIGYDFKTANTNSFERIQKFKQVPHKWKVQANVTMKALDLDEFRFIVINKNIFNIYEFIEPYDEFIYREALSTCRMIHKKTANNEMVPRYYETPAEGMKKGEDCTYCKNFKECWSVSKFEIEEEIFEKNIKKAPKTVSKRYFAMLDRKGDINKEIKKLESSTEVSMLKQLKAEKSMINKEINSFHEAYKKPIIQYDQNGKTYYSKMETVEKVSYDWDKLKKMPDIENYSKVTESVKIDRFKRKL